MHSRHYSRIASAQQLRSYSKPKYHQANRQRKFLGLFMMMIGVLGLISVIGFILMRIEGPAVAGKQPGLISVPSVVSTNSPVVPTPTAMPSPQNMRDTCNDLLVQIDKTSALPEKYTPPDLVFLADYSFSVSTRAVQGRQVMISDLQKLFSEITKEGIQLVVSSAYRSYAQQASLYNTYAAQYGTKEANKFSAKPGHSQHQLGTAIDFSNAETGYTLIENFENIRAGRWLLANAYKYGFFLSYPKGSEELTGYKYEPWHYRYIGVQNALALHQSGEIMQTYLSKHGSKPQC